MKEKNYIHYRKLKAFGNKICFYVCRIFPIKKNLISVCTFEGKGGFGCNPKYIVQEMHKRNPAYEFVWFVNDMSKEFPDYIKKVPNNLWSRAFWLSRSKVWIDNYRKPYGTCKRKKQYYLNVNHYTLSIKTLGLWRGKGFSPIAYMVSKNDSDMIDDLVIDSKFCEIMCPKGLVYNGTYLKTGAPRCDVLFGDRSKYKEKFRLRHGLKNTDRVVMFAPTFREGAVDGKRVVFSETWSIDFKRLIANLENKFGGNWYICIRVHPQLAETFEDYSEGTLHNRFINESKADDMYELLAAMDAYITDYSSACFEAGYAGIPVFLFADDVSQYEKDRGALFWKLSEYRSGLIKNDETMLAELDTSLPFLLATDNDELEKNILEFDEHSYSDRLKTFHSDIELVFEGNASEKIVDKIEQEIKHG